MYSRETYLILFLKKSSTGLSKFCQLLNCRSSQRTTKRCTTKYISNWFLIVLLPKLLCIFSDLIRALQNQIILEKRKANFFIYNPQKCISNWFLIPLLKKLLCILSDFLQTVQNKNMLERGANFVI